MSEMVQRVARAIWLVEREIFGAPVPPSEQVCPQSYAKMAIAAIKVMRKPSLEMAIDAYEARDEDETLIEIYSAMIDAALK